MKDLITTPDQYTGHFPEQGLQAAWKSPSNIALVKYWGKHGQQLPANPSVSLTLSASHTMTRVKAFPKGAGSPRLDFRFGGRPAPAFAGRIERTLQGWEEYLPFVKDTMLEIDTSNSFPHSAGIASSASAMSALALCLLHLERTLGVEYTDEAFFRKASFLSRLGSGSACRSVYPHAALWGATPSRPASSDLYAMPLPEVDPVFLTMRDTILIVDPGQKAVSSSAGHGLMNRHDFARERFSQAHRHTDQLLRAMEEGDLEAFIRITEQEALTLHGLMMSSDPGYILIRPGTIQIINRVRNFREQNTLPLCFTLDAGPNVHLLYPESVATEVEVFIREELLAFCDEKRMIADGVGNGPEAI